MSGINAWDDRKEKAREGEMGRARSEKMKEGIFLRKILCYASVKFFHRFHQPIKHILHSSSLVFTHLKKDRQGKQIMLHMKCVH